MAGIAPLTWQDVWHRGISPHLPRAGLEALRDELAAGGGCLLHAAAASPTGRGSACRAACAIGYAGWKGEGLSGVDEVFDAFDRVCSAADAALRRRPDERPLSAFFQFWDGRRHTDAEKRRLLLAEVEKSLAAA